MEKRPVQVLEMKRGIGKELEFDEYIGKTFINKNQLPLVPHPRNYEATKSREEKNTSLKGSPFYDVFFSF